MARDRQVRFILVGDSKSAERSLKATEVAAEKTSRSLGRAGERAKETHGQFRVLGEGAGMLRGRMMSLAGVAGLGGVAFGLEDVVKAGQSRQVQQARLQTALRNTGNASVENLKRLNEVAERLSTRGGFAGKENVQALSQFLIATKSVGKAQRDLGIATNVSRQTGRDFFTVVKAISLAEQGRTTGLSRLGIALPKVTSAVDRLHQMYKKVPPVFLAQAKAQDALASKTSVLMLLQQRFGGATERYSRTTAGAISNAKNAIDGAMERIGAAFLPVVARAAQWIARLTESAMKYWPQIKKIAKDVFGAVGKALSDTIDWIKGAIGWLGKHKDAAAALKGGLIVLVGGIVAVTAVMKAWVIVQGAINLLMAANPIGAVIVAIAALAAGLVYAYRTSKDFRDIVNGAWGVLQDFGRWVTSAKFLDWWNQRIQMVVGSFKDLVRTAKDVKKFIDGIGGFLNDPFGSSGKQVVRGASRSQLAQLQSRVAWTGVKVVPATVPGRAAGGLVGGFDRGRDSVLTALQPGEYVLRKQVVRAVGVNRLNSLNAGETMAPSGQPNEIVIPVTLQAGGRVLATEVARYSLKMNARS